MNERELTIACDIDDTKQPFIVPWVEWLNIEYPESNYQVERITSYRIKEIYPEPNVDWNKRLDDFVESGFQLKYSPFEGAKETLQALGRAARLIIVTARPEHHREYTEAWLDKEFPDVFADVHMRPDYEAPYDKGELCRRIGASVLIDDAVHNVDAASRAGVRGILYGDYPMQTNYVRTHHERAYDWQEVGELLQNDLL